MLDATYLVSTVVSLISARPLAHGWMDGWMDGCGCVCVVFQVFAYGDPYDVETNAEGEADISAVFDEFMAWRSSSSNLLGSANIDNAQLFSSLAFNDSMTGYSWTGGMCSDAYSGGVEQLASAAGNDAVNAVLVAHNVGHNLNMKHDGDGNACPTTGCVCLFGLFVWFVSLFVG